MSAETSYDPFNRAEEREAEAFRDAQRAHEHWSREQARLGRAASERDGQAAWVPLPKDES